MARGTKICSDRAKANRWATIIRPYEKRMKGPDISLESSERGMSIARKSVKKCGGPETLREGPLWHEVHFQLSLTPKEQ